MLVVYIRKGIKVKMGLSHSSKVVTDGLVFYYDMSNTQKSWKGAPTTNFLLQSQVYSINWSLTDTGSPCTIVSNTFAAPDGTQTASAIVNSTSVTTLFRQSVNTSDIGTGIITSSIYAKSYTSDYFTFNTYYPGDSEVNISFTLTGSGSTSDPANSTITPVGNGWYRCTIKTPAKVNTGTSVEFRAWPAGRGTTTAGAGNLFWGAQLEQGTFATPYIKTTITTVSRLNTQAIVDLTGNNTITANSLTYNSDGSFNFNGSSSLITAAPTYNLSSGVSMEMVFKSLDIQSRGQGYMTFSPAPAYINFYSPGDSTLRWETWVNAGTGLGGAFFSPANLSNNTWYHAVGTYYNGVSVLYINGVLVNTATYVATNYSSSYSAQLRIGEYAGYLNGSITLSKLYNRALSAAEVKQNFNAHRGRYGI